MILGMGNFPTLEIKKVNKYIVINEIFGVKTIDKTKVYLKEIREIIPYTQEQLLERLLEYINYYGLNYVEFDDKLITWNNLDEAKERLKEVIKCMWKN